MKKILVMVLVNTKFGATNTDTLENVHDHAVKLNVVYGAGQTIMTKVTGARVIRLAARAACFSIFEHTHARIKEAADLWFIAFIRCLRGDLYHRAALNFIRRKDAELNTDDRLNIRRNLIETCGHSVLEIETVV